MWVDDPEDEKAAPTGLGRWVDAVGIVPLAGAAAALVVLAWMLAPSPVPADFGTAGKGPMQVTVDEEGKTAVKEVYVVAAPLAGRLLRLPVHAGDPVVAGKTVVAAIHPAAPAFLDERTRKELEALANAARAAVDLAAAEVRQTESDLAWARRELERSTQLLKRETVSERAHEKAQIDVDRAAAALQRAKANLDLRGAELKRAEAQLITPSTQSVEACEPASCQVELRAPQSGTVLRLVEESETIVRPGQTLVEIGDTRALEIEVEMLSADAVRIKPGDAARVEGTGLAAPLAAKVRRIDPAGFTKVSALGIEEQRVKVILDFEGPPETYRSLGHAFRVFVRIAVWQAESVLRVPLSALFRIGGEWALFAVEDGRAVVRRIEIGQRNAEFAEVLSGVTEGAAILLHPSDRVSSGVAVTPRDQL